MESNCVCLKCGQKYYSEDELDQDGDGWCATCKEAKAKIAKRVDEEMKKLRAQRAAMPQPQANIPKMNLYYEAGNQKI